MGCEGALYRGDDLLPVVDEHLAVPYSEPYSKFDVVTTLKLSCVCLDFLDNVCRPGRTELLWVSFGLRVRGLRVVREKRWYHEANMVKWPKKCMHWF